jgi:hypothetical protein
MASRIRDENALRPAQPGYPRKILKRGNENSSITRPTLASSAKVKPGRHSSRCRCGEELITGLKPKESRTVLAPLSKTTNTPRAKSDVPENKELLTTKSGPSLKPRNPVQTPKPVKKVLPKSTKKTINVYTPARTSSPAARDVRNQGVVDEVECSHPKPPGQQSHHLSWIS